MVSTVVSDNVNTSSPQNIHRLDSLPAYAVLAKKSYDVFWITFDIARFKHYREVQKTNELIRNKLRY
jgi:hypothetical protein